MFGEQHKSEVYLSHLYYTLKSFSSSNKKAALPLAVPSSSTYYSILFYSFFPLHLLKSNYRPTNYHHLPHHTFLSSFIINSTPNTTRAMPVTTLSFIPPIRGSLQRSFIMFIANHLQFHKSFLGIFNINKAVMAIHTGIGILFHLLSFADDSIPKI